MPSPKPKSTKSKVELSEENNSTGKRKLPPNTKHLKLSVALGLPIPAEMMQKAPELKRLSEDIQSVFTRPISKAGLTTESEKIVDKHGRFIWTTPRNISVETTNGTVKSESLVYPRHRRRLVEILTALLEVKLVLRKRSPGDQFAVKRAYETLGGTSTDSSASSVQDQRPSTQAPSQTSTPTHGEPKRQKLQESSRQLNQTGQASGPPPTDQPEANPQRGLSNARPLEAGYARPSIHEPNGSSSPQDNKHMISPGTNVHEVVSSENAKGMILVELLRHGDPVPFVPSISAVRTTEDLFAVFRRTLGLTAAESIRPRTIVTFKPPAVAPRAPFQIAQTDIQGIFTLCSLLRSIDWDKVEEKICMVEFMVEVQT